ncbi:MAG TPA: phosphonopyruvate decarboxylase [Gammaproteobacteria bacterium]|nr:phosphonopyruvate decarboxylase [Gammaproteobacteria bacterium]
MITAQSFIQSAMDCGFTHYSGVPCSYLKPFINYVIDDPGLNYIGAANEGDAVAIAAGAQLGGTRAVVMFQNSGLGNAINPLTSLCYTFNIPVLLIITLRGEPEGAPDEPQHNLMGEITTRMLELMQVPWEYFPDREQDIAPVLERALQYMDRTHLPYALIMRKGAVNKWPLHTEPQSRTIYSCYNKSPSAIVGTRAQTLRVIQCASRQSDILLATTGYTGRELYALKDKPNQFYMVGSMGCAISLGLGIALVQPKRRIIVIDGDGALLMRMGALATTGYERPDNLLHILLDNQCHESTGGQSTVSHSIDFNAIAAACGYQNVRCVASLDELDNLLGQGKGLTFYHVRIAPGIPDDLPRPEITPAQVAQRLRQFIGE